MSPFGLGSKPESINDLKDKKDLKKLVKALESVGNPGFREDAAKALDELGWKPQNEKERSLYFLSKREWEKVKRESEPATKLLLNEIYWPNVGLKALTVLGLIGNKSVIDPIMQILKSSRDREEEFYLEAAQTLEKIGKTEVQSKLAEHIKSSAKYSDRTFILAGPSTDALWRDTAIILTRLPSLSLEPLLEALNNPKIVISSYAASALYDISDFRAVPFLIQAMESPHWIVRKNAALVLGEIGDQQALPSLIQAFKDWASDPSFHYGDLVGDEGGRGNCFKTAAEALLKLGLSVEELNSHLSFNGFLQTICEINNLGYSKLHKFNNYLRTIGFNSTILEYDLTSKWHTKSSWQGIIKLESAAITYIIKDISWDTAVIKFIIENDEKKSVMLI